MRRRFVPACLVLGTFLRVAWIYLVDPDQVSDFSWYQQFATNIALGKGYSINGMPTGYWPIGYPAFLGGLFYLFGPSVLVGKVANIVLYMGTIFLTYTLSKRLFDSEPAARITVGILSLYPNHIAYTALLSSEILFVFLVALSIFVFDIADERPGFILLSGLLFGLTTLTKPQAIMLPLVALPLLSTSAKRVWRPLILVYGALVAAVLPWMARNYVVMGKPTLANTAGLDLLDGNNPYANGGHHFTDRVNDLLGDLETKPLENVFDGKEVARDARARDLAIDFIAHNPAHFAALVPLKWIQLFLWDVDGFDYSLRMMTLPRHVERPADCIAELYYVFMIILFLVALPATLRARSRRQQVGLAIIIYLTIVYSVVFGQGRFHFPMMPWLAMYSGIGAWRVLWVMDA
jgi:4-amino-4-deoxy-L-arabinose transferase-like glycosyltransferase